MGIGEFPDDVLRLIGFNLNSKDRATLSRVNRRFFQTFIPLLYSKVAYSNQRVVGTGRDEQSGYLVFLNDTNIRGFLLTSLQRSIMGFQYSELIVELYLEDFNFNDKDMLIEWRQHLNEGAFIRLKRYLFPQNIEIKPLTFEEAPQLDTLVIDKNFCGMVDSLHGVVNFINYEHIKKLFFTGTLGHNEDMSMFKLVTSHPHMIHGLSELHFSVNDGENYNSVYRRLVGFCAILRKFNIHLPNINSLSLPLTNQSSDAIVNLLGRHIIFENLNSLTLLIQDDADVLTLIKPIDKLGGIIRTHGINIEQLTIKYHLIKRDEEKNHLRSMMLLKLCESFHKLQKLSIELNIMAMNLSNLLMILGAPISNNLKTLRDININIHSPCENFVNQILPTLEDASMIFPHLNFINNCQCEICGNIFEKLHFIERMKLEQQQNNSFFGFGRLRRHVIEPNPELFNETIKVGTLLIVGQELDQLQQEISNKYSTEGSINKFKGNGWLRSSTSPYYSRGYLLDHLIRPQLNQSFIRNTKIQNFELCGLVYYRDLNLGGFQLRYGEQFSGLKDEDLNGIVDLGHMFVHN